MLSPKDFYDQLENKGIGFYTGVPDSLLKDFCAYVTDNTSANNHVIAENEGNAIALASGYHLATGKIGVVYMQNSCLGNCVNPLTSLTDFHAYSIPMLLIVGWRGEPGKKDEPQHVKQGEITLDLLKVLGVPYEILPQSMGEIKKVIDKAVNYMEINNSPFAIVVIKCTFEPYQLQNKKETNEINFT